MMMSVFCVDLDMSLIIIHYQVIGCKYFVHTDVVVGGLSVCNCVSVLVIGVAIVALCICQF